MQQISYMGNGHTTEFVFNFTYYDTNNIRVTINDKPATGYNIIVLSDGPDSDVPYTGGTVVFDSAPRATDCITISRHLPLERVVDYQPLVPIDPIALNRDMNYMMDVLKDMKAELGTLCTQYRDITEHESVQTLLNRMDAMDEQITALGDVGQIRTNIATLNTRTDGLLDYVTEMQMPCAENNYTWYRKYKSGWVEQGGIGMSESSANQWNSITVTFPVKMRDTNYVATGTAYGLDSVSTLLVCIGGINADNAENGHGKTTTNMVIQTERLFTGGPARVSCVQWHVYGISA